MMLPITPRTQPGGGAPYRTPPASRERAVEADAEESWPRYLRGLVWLLCALIAWTTLLAWREHRRLAGIQALPAVTRHDVYQHAVDELRTICASQPAALQDHCATQATFVLDFPECDGDCRALADRALDRARR